MEMNETLNCMETRRSVRGYEPDRVPADELIEAVARAGTFAPTGMGAQSPVIVAVTNRGVRDRLSRLNAEVLGTDSDPDTAKAVFDGIYSACSERGVFLAAQ